MESGPDREEETLEPGGEAGDPGEDSWRALLPRQRHAHGGGDALEVLVRHLEQAAAEDHPPALGAGDERQIAHLIGDPPDAVNA